MNSIFESVVPLAMFWIGSGHWTSERRQNVMLRIPFAAIISFPYNCEGVLWSFIDFLYVITSQHNHIKGRKYTEYLLIYKILPPTPQQPNPSILIDTIGLSLLHTIFTKYFSVVWESSPVMRLNFKVELILRNYSNWFQLDLDCERDPVAKFQFSGEFPNILLKSSIWTKAWAYICWLSIHQFSLSKNIQQVLGLQRWRLSKLHRTSSTIRRIFTYQGWVWTAGFIDDLTITVPDSWQSITTLRLSFTFPAPTQLASGRFGVQIKRMDFWQ